MVLCGGTRASTRPPVVLKDTLSGHEAGPQMEPPSPTRRRFIWNLPPPDPDRQPHTVSYGLLLASSDRQSSCALSAPLILPLLKALRPNSFINCDIYIHIYFEQLPANPANVKYQADLLGLDIIFCNISQEKK